jgi:hypothetical protein
MGEDEIDEGRSGLSAVAISYSFPETVVITSMLRAYGIPSTTNPWQAVTVDPLWMVALGGMRISVPDVHFADAQALLWAAEPHESDWTGGWSEAGWANIVLSVLFLVVWGFAPPPRVRLEIAGHPFQQAWIDDDPEPDPV